MLLARAERAKSCQNERNLTGCLAVEGDAETFICYRMACIAFCKHTL